MKNLGLVLAAALALSLPAAARSAAKAEVQCTDGSVSKGGRGACSGHGGIAKEGKVKEGKAKEPQARAKPPAAKEAEAPQARAKVPAAKESKEPQAGNAPADKKGGVLGGLFGRRDTKDTPRSSTRDAKSGNPTARCKDGTMSYSAHHSGTCSGHGGVQDWLDK